MEKKCCYFRSVNKCQDEEKLNFVTAGPLRIQTIIACSKQYDDGLCIQLEGELSKNKNLTIQISCR